LNPPSLLSISRQFALFHSIHPQSPVTPPSLLSIRIPSFLFPEFRWPTQTNQKEFFLCILTNPEIRFTVFLWVERSIRRKSTAFNLVIFAIGTLNDWSVSHIISIHSIYCLNIVNIVESDLQICHVASIVDFLILVGQIWLIPRWISLSRDKSHYPIVRGYFFVPFRTRNQDVRSAEKKQNICEGYQDKKMS
jgi:hypothetical protein